MLLVLLVLSSDRYAGFVKQALPTPWLGSPKVELVHATRYPAEVGASDLVPLIEFGASPRATIALGQAARAHAFLRGRAFVTPDDVKSIAPDVLRHRVLTTFEADAEGVTSDTIVTRLLAAVETP